MENNQPKIESREDKLRNKRIAWDKKMTEMLQPDVYGYVLDEKIRETIVVLNLLGINTTQSDQGNYSDSPWIEFESPVPQSIYVGEYELRVEILKKRNLELGVMDTNSSIFDRGIQVDVWEDSRVVLMKNGAEYTPEFLKYLKDTETMAKKMQNFIDNYYSLDRHPKNAEVRVIVSYPNEGSWDRPYIQHVPLLDVSTPDESNSAEERALILEKTLGEMLEFTQYLKDVFFQDK
jgi:hypothetical protein